MSNTGCSCTNLLTDVQRGDFVFVLTKCAQPGEMPLQAVEAGFLQDFNDHVIQLDAMGILNRGRTTVCCNKICAISRLITV
ncbi:hypothetical protein [Alteribacillus sp. YIM 98480]|uniref:hypothetical protein n=1 Tax=Alteribacillus sp. YIM 98480 TaxID=2606599 RepID=UPI00131C5F75|nr:hypothetical protein [Alteribacillus sp. YIM 98480]